MVEVTSNKSGDMGIEAVSLIETAWNEAAINWDPDRFVEIYSPDALFFGARPDLYVGRERIRQYFASYSNSVKSASMKLFDQHILPLGKDAVLAQGFVEFNLIMASGEKVRLIQGTTLTFEQENGRWLIKNHHFSTRPENPPFTE